MAWVDRSPEKLWFGASRMMSAFYLKAFKRQADLP